MRVALKPLTLAGLACLALAGCSHQDNTSSAPGGPTTSSSASTVAPGTITIGYSDWPGWTAWDIADKEGFFKKHNVNVTLKWFPTYTDSLNALQAGAIDANCQTWSDTIPQLAASPPVPLKAVLINDNSAGNDAVVAGPGINSMKDLKGKNVATEQGTVEQFLLDQALAASGMTEKDIHYLPIKVQDCPAAMASHKIDACAVWEPNKSQLLQQMPGTHVIFDSKKLPGLIPDLLVFQQKTVDGNKADIQGIVDAWYDALAWWKANPDEALKVMSTHTPGTEDQRLAFYKGFIQGTRIFDGPEAEAAFTKSDKVTSLYASAPEISQFLIGQQQIKAAPDYAGALDNEFVKAAVAKGEGKQPPYDYPPLSSATVKAQTAKVD